ncbi:hypothetical protein K2X85_04070 [bacterium]|jgi:hypothetical protein|nr:hypothetical protein [bacterium]
MGLGFWVREIIGWCLVALGIYGFWITLAFLAVQPARLIEGSTTAVVSTVLFRGGLSLIRVATAARIVLQSRPTSLTKK